MGWLAKHCGCAPLRTYSNTLYIGTHNGLYRLPAGVTTWAQVTTFPATGILFSLLVHDKALYVGTDDGLYRSADGDNWEKVANFPVTAVNALVSTGRLIVAATDTGLWNGAGDTWQPSMLNGAPYAGSVFALTNTPKAARTIYAGTQLDWVLRSDDEGVTFHAIADMPAIDVKAALATPTPTATPSIHPPTRRLQPIPQRIRPHRRQRIQQPTHRYRPIPQRPPLHRCRPAHPPRRRYRPIHLCQPTTPIIAATATPGVALTSSVPVTQTGPVSITVSLPTARVRDARAAALASGNNPATATASLVSGQVLHLEYANFTGFGADGYAIGSVDYGSVQPSGVQFYR